MRYAYVKDEVVTNVIELDPEMADSWEPPSETILVSLDGHFAGPGWGYTGGAFYPPPEPEIVVEVPETISDRQFFQELSVIGMCSEAEALAAVQVGQLPAAMDAIIDSLPSDQQFSARMLLTGATEFKRHHPVVSVFATAVGWDDAQTDTFWIDASQL